MIKQKKEKKDKTRKKGFKIKVAVISVLVVILAVIGGVGIYAYTVLNKINGAEIENTLISDEIADYVSNTNIKNVLILGLDSRADEYESTEEVGIRSDVIMVASFNMTDKTVSLTSFERDTLLKCPSSDYGTDGFINLNHAYQFGGVEGTVQVLNYNFDLDIDDYVIVNFWAVEKIIDRVGGVDIELTSEELTYANNLVNSLNSVSPDNTKSALISSSGLQTLNGRQALAYMRIRKTDGADYKRMERQRTVMLRMLSSIGSLGITDIIGLLNDCTPYVVTNLELNEMISIAKMVLTADLNNISQYQIPASGNVYTKIFWENKFYHEIMTNMEEDIKNWHETIYGKEYTVSSLISEISQEIQAYAESQVGLDY